jgi:hypothetical protein
VGRLAAGAVVVAVLAACSGGGSSGDGRDDGSTGAAALGPGGVGALGTLLGEQGASGGTATGSGSAAGATDTGTTSATPTGSTDPSAGPASGSPTSIAGLPAVTQVRDVTVGDYVAFATPSRNIGCATDGTFVRCDIQNRDWKPPPKPSSCPGDYGQGVELADGRAQFVCAGDTVLTPDAELLPYNQAIRAGDIVCVSTKAYLICRNTATNHGFSLSKEAVPPMF